MSKITNNKLRWITISHDDEEINLPIFNGWEETVSCAEYLGEEGSLNITIQAASIIDPARLREVENEYTGKSDILLSRIVEIQKRACLKLILKNDDIVVLLFFIPLGFDDEIAVKYTLYKNLEEFLPLIENIETPNVSFLNIDKNENVNEHGQLEVYPVIVPDIWKIVDENGNLLPLVDNPENKNIKIGVSGTLMFVDDFRNAALVIKELWFRGPITDIILGQYTEETIERYNAKGYSTAIKCKKLTEKIVDDNVGGLVVIRRTADDGKGFYEMHLLVCDALIRNWILSYQINLESLVQYSQLINDIHDLMKTGSKMIY
jgi:hypothetical protein